MWILTTLLTIAVIPVIAYIAILRQHFKMRHVKTLTIIRGIPGSGKSTLAAQLVANSNGALAYYETDQYMYNDAGEYEWTEERWLRAIDQVYDSVYLRMTQDKDVIVCGIFMRWAPMRDLVGLAQDNGYRVRIITCLGDFGSIHPIPADKVARIKERFIPNEGLPQMQGILYSTHLAVAECSTM
jgi:predicted ABC-type ATPase